MSDSERPEPSEIYELDFTGEVSPEPMKMNGMIERQMVWDMLPHNQMSSELMARLGMTGFTDDGMEMEHAQSHRRILGLKNTVPLVTTLSSMAARLIARAILIENGVELSEDDFEKFLVGVDNQVTAGVLAVIMELVSLGVMSVSEMEQV